MLCFAPRHAVACFNWDHRHTSLNAATEGWSPASGTRSALNLEATPWGVMLEASGVEATAEGSKWEGRGVKVGTQGAALATRRGALGAWALALDVRGLAVKTDGELSLICCCVE